jgi:general secretion pathway protein G
MKRAFTMIELVFVIVVIGILASIAIPKLAATRDDAEITKAIATIGAVKSSLATERQKRIIRGDFTGIDSLGDADTVFGNFSADQEGDTSSVLDTPVSSCAVLDKDEACWSKVGDNYIYSMPAGEGDVAFTINNGIFECVNPDDANCIELTQ